MPVTLTTLEHLLGPTLGVFIVFAAIAFLPATRAFGQEAKQPQSVSAAGQAATSRASTGQTSTGEPSTSQPPADQTPAAPTPVEKIPGVDLYNLLEKKSIVFPDIAASKEPLSSGQKFQLFVDNSGSVHTLSWAMLGSAIAQADNSPTGFGQGWDGYAKRFGASMARQASSEFFGTFVIASALHLDPRFYPEVNPTFKQAVKYSVQRVFIMRKDDGRDVVAWSRLVGPLMSETLANVYWPERNRTVGDTFFRYGLDLATRAGGNMLREYWPVVYRKMGHTTRRTAKPD
jgi:hypothetical protein